MFFAELDDFYSPLFDKTIYMNIISLPGMTNPPTAISTPTTLLINAYPDLIIKATGASGDEVTIIENIISGEIFHSTTDWQPPRQLANAARKAPGGL